MAGNPQNGGPELTPRICRYCRRPYLAEKGARPHACPRCASTIMDAIADASGARGPALSTGEASDAMPQAPEAPAIAEPEKWPEPPHWTESECQVKGCGEPAGARTGDWIICLDHADDWLDRIQAIELHPELRDLLPALGDE